MSFINLFLGSNNVIKFKYIATSRVSRLESSKFNRTFLILLEILSKLLIEAMKEGQKVFKSLTYPNLRKDFIVKQDKGLLWPKKLSISPKTGTRTIYHTYLCMKRYHEPFYAATNTKKSRRAYKPRICKT